MVHTGKLSFKLETPQPIQSKRKQNKKRFNKKKGVADSKKEPMASYVTPSQVLTFIRKLTSFDSVTINSN